MDYKNKTWKYIEQHPILLIPKAVGLIGSILWFVIIYWMWKFIDTLWIHMITKEITQLTLVAVYLVIEMLLIFYVTRVQYAMYQQIVHKKKLDSKKLMRFAHDDFLHITGLSLLIYGLIGIPAVSVILLLSAVIIGDINHLVSGFYIGLLLVWVLLVSWRVMFKTKTLSTHHMHKSAHLSKTHVRHTIATWIGATVVISLFAVYTQEFIVFSVFDVWLATVAALCILVIEVVVSVWEHLLFYQTHFEEKVKTTKK